MDQADPDEVRAEVPVDQVARDRVGRDSDHPMLRWIFRSGKGLTLGARTSGRTERLSAKRLSVPCTICGQCPRSRLQAYIFFAGLLHKK